jgi:hypothetical protein
MTGRRGDAEKLAARHQGYPFRLATIYAALYDKARAIEALSQLVLTEPHRVVDLLSYPELAGVRDDARLAAVRKKLNLP